jgi:glycerol-3-phosphate dehydrogenase
VTEPYDIAIVGGGITGLGLARLAARNGYRCVVLDRGDRGSGSSSSSSHMLHGGLRYLEQGRFGLVRESLAERLAVHRMAPTLTQPQRFMVPLFRGDRVGPWRLRAGLTLYDWLAGSSRLSPGSVVRRKEALALEPGLASKRLRGAGLYTDVVMDDGRLAIAVARDAAAHGADVKPYVQVHGGRPAGPGVTDIVTTDVLDGGERVFPARVLVNATGPWSDHVRMLFARTLAPGTPDPTPLLRPSRGVHLVYPKLTSDHGLVLVAKRDGRVFFVVPFADRSLVGTTEVELPSPPAPESWRASLDEARYLRAELARVLPESAKVEPIAVMSGLRPLLRSDQAAGQASREHAVIEEDRVITVTGGKYTTFRVMARDALERVARRLGRAGRPISDCSQPLPAPIAASSELDRVAEFAVRHEFARRVVDVVRRRTTLWLEPDRGRVAAARIAAVMGGLLDWSAERQRDEFQSYDQALWEEESLIQRSSAEP